MQTKKLRSDTVVLLSCFNFFKNPAREQALHRSLISLQGVADVILVCHGVAIAALPSRDNLQVIDVPQASVVWQKERFFNLALQYLKPRHRYVGWSDSDLMYANGDWIDQLKTALQAHHLVQLFDAVWDVELQQNGAYRLTETVRESAVKLLVTGQIGSEEFFTRSGVSLRMGCNPGMAWGARADLIRDIGFPDFMLLGSGDKLMLAAAMHRTTDYCEILGLNSGLQDTCYAWAERASGHIQKKIGYIDNTLCHIAQGDYENRQYGHRYASIRNGRFELDRYLFVNPYGAWQWRSEDNDYARAIKRYFYERGD